MRKILIAGANSYIGTSIEKWLLVNKYDKVDTIAMTDDEWKSYNFSKYDVVFFVAGIVHRKETMENKELYYKINKDLAVEVAKKSKQEGIKQFIYLSTISVYGINTGCINDNTPLNPTNNYGKSKKEAEIELNKLNDEEFKVCIVRPPMVYGKAARAIIKS